MCIVGGMDDVPLSVCDVCSFRCSWNGSTLFRRICGVCVMRVSCCSS